MVKVTICACVTCGQDATWIRKTQFSGMHGFCEGHAKMQKDFGQESSYFFWEQLPQKTKKKLVDKPPITS